MSNSPKSQSGYDCDYPSSALLYTDPVVDQLLDQFQYFIGLLNESEEPATPLTPEGRNGLVIELCRLSRQIGLRLSRLDFVSDDDVNRSVVAFESVKTLIIPDQSNPEVTQAIKNIIGRATNIATEFRAKAKIV